MFFRYTLIAANERILEHVYDNIWFSILVYAAKKVPILLLVLHGCIKSSFRHYNTLEKNLK